MRSSTEAARWSRPRWQSSLSRSGIADTPNRDGEREKADDAKDVDDVLDGARLRPTNGDDKPKDPEGDNDQDPKPS